MPIVIAVMVLSLLAGLVEAWRGNMGRCFLFLVIGLVAAGFVILRSFVPGANR